MAFTNDDYLPSYAELDVEEINMSSAPLRAGARYFGKYCDEQSKEFMLCVKEEKDPRKCVNEGKEVTRCGLEFYRKVKVSCPQEFTDYWTCLDHGFFNMGPEYCPKQQKILETCLVQKMQMAIPETGYFSKVRVHHTKRPLPDPVNIPLPKPSVEPVDPKTVPIPKDARIMANIP